MDIVEKHHHAGQFLPGLGHPELAGGHQRVDGVGTGIGEGDHIRPRALGLQDVGGEVAARERVPNLADHLAAIRFDDLADVRFHRVTEGIVGGEDEPVLAAVGEHRLGGAVGQGVGVVGPVDVVGRAVFIGQAGGRRAGNQRQFPGLLHHLARRQHHRGRHHAGDHVDIALIDPLAHGVGADIRLVQVIGAEHDNLLAIDLAAEIFDGHVQRFQATGAGQVAVGPRHVRQVTDTDFVVTDLGLGRAGDQAGDEDGACCVLKNLHVVHPLSEFIFIVPGKAAPCRRALGHGDVRSARGKTGFRRRDSCAAVPAWRPARRR
ncbi:hypothetical protein D3C84_236840 [compost metagenome]